MPPHITAAKIKPCSGKKKVTDWQDSSECRQLPPNLETWVPSLGYLLHHGRKKWTLESSSDLRTVTKVQISIRFSHYFWDCCESAGLDRDHVEKREWSRLMGEEH